MVGASTRQSSQQPCSKSPETRSFAG